MAQRSYHTWRKVFLIFIGLLLFIPFYQAFACTLFGAIGNPVEGGGVLIGKTRDRPKALEQAFIEVLPKSGYGYRGISLKGVRSVTSGMNEKGLVVVSATASNVEKEDKVTTVGRILSKAASVDEVIALAQKGEIKGPIHYLVGDIHKIALLEIIDGRRYEFLVKENGVLSHTNHFILKEMTKFNPKIGVSSQARLNRIENLLRDGSFTKDKFIAFTQDHFNGRGNNSICRHFEVGVQSSERTVSAAVYYLPKDSAPKIWVSLGQPCQSMSERH
jgi:predicted choloylglycine hydrolase